MNPASRHVRPAPIHRRFRVPLPCEAAFQLFMHGMGRWWPKDMSLLKSPRREVRVEPRADGRWYEVGEDGSQYQWGRVLEWEPPNRALLAWQLTAGWAYDPAFETEIEILFRPDGDATMVEFEHRKLEAYETGRRDELLNEMDEGWSAILGGYERMAVHPT